MFNKKLLLVFLLIMPAINAFGANVDEGHYELGDKVDSDVCQMFVDNMNSFIGSERQHPMVCDLPINDQFPRLHALEFEDLKGDERLDKILKERFIFLEERRTHKDVDLSNDETVKRLLSSISSIKKGIEEGNVFVGIKYIDVNGDGKEEYLIELSSKPKRSSYCGKIYEGNVWAYKAKHYVLDSEFHYIKQMTGLIRSLELTYGMRVFEVDNVVHMVGWNFSPFIDLTKDYRLAVYDLAKSSEKDRLFLKGVCAIYYKDSRGSE